MDDTGNDVRDSYDRVTEEYVARIAEELEHKPLDRQLLERFATDVRGVGLVCDVGCGPGHVARYLHDNGASVRGLDLSPAMVARLRAKPGGAEIGVTMGDFASTRVAGPFRLAYLLFNTITNLTTQDEQVACFRNAAAHVEPEASSPAMADEDEGAEDEDARASTRSEAPPADGSSLPMIATVEPIVCSKRGENAASGRLSSSILATKRRCVRRFQSPPTSCGSRRQAIRFCVSPISRRSRRSVRPLARSPS